MKKQILIPSALIFFALFMAVPSVNAQMKYADEQFLTIGGGEPNPNYGITINGFKKLNFYSPSSRFLVDCDHTFCYFEGSGWQIVFYNADTRTYNDVRAFMVRLSANGEIYDDWIGEIEDPSAILNSLTPVTYRFKNSNSQAKSLQSSEIPVSTDRHIGFLAQDVEKVLPQAVSSDSEGNKGIDYIAILPVVVKSIQHLYDRIEENEKKLDNLSDNGL